MMRETTKGCGRSLRDLTVAAFFVLLAMTGCATGSGTYYEKHEITGLAVVFLDEQSLQAKWTDITGKEFGIHGTPVSPTISDVPAAPNQLPVVHKVRGVFDHRTNTIYCPKMDFEVCGRELHHAVLGQLHAEHH
ncbi:MAG: hypothetical protein HY581_10745 [Nitrospirae bacterium]|nr:hypothetical protein [Nitrospirota bacterium]